MALLLWFSLFLFLHSPNPPHPEKKKKKNVLVKAISAKRGFLVKCGGNQLNAELKGRRDGSQICRLLKSRTPSPPLDLAPCFNYPHPTVSLLTLCFLLFLPSISLCATSPPRRTSFSASLLSVPNGGRAHFELPWLLPTDAASPLQLSRLLSFRSVRQYQSSSFPFFTNRSPSLPPSQRSSL